MTAENLLLRLRAETLKANLSTTLDHMRELTEQRTHFAELKAVIEETKGEIGKARTRINKTRLLPEKLEIQKEIQQIDKDAERAFTKVEKAESELRKLEALLFGPNPTVLSRAATWRFLVMRGRRYGWPCPVRIGHRGSRAPRTGV